MFGATNLALDLAQTASEGKRGRIKVNTPSARNARMAAVLNGPRPASVTPAAWSRLRDNLSK